MSKNIPGNNLLFLSVIWNETLTHLVHRADNKHFVAQFQNTAVHKGTGVYTALYKK
jgi:hypothetical protein